MGRGQRSPASVAQRVRHGEPGQDEERNPSDLAGGACHPTKDPAATSAVTIVAASASWIARSSVVRLRSPSKAVEGYFRVVSDR